MSKNEKARRHGQKEKNRAEPAGNKIQIVNENVGESKINQSLNTLSIQSQTVADEAYQLPSASRDDGPSTISQRSDRTAQPQPQPMKRDMKLKVLENIIDKVPLKMKLGSKVASQRQSYQRQKFK